MAFVQHLFAVRGLFSFSRFGVSKLGQAIFYLEQQIFGGFEFSCSSSMRSWGQAIKKERKKWNKRKHGVHPCVTLHKVSHRVYNKPCAKHSHRYHQNIPSAVSPSGEDIYCGAPRAVCSSRGRLHTCDDVNLSCTGNITLQEVKDTAAR